jgi:mRNA interferase MazF
MPLRYHPRPGQILMCDFSKGFVAPEMVKTRPVVVLSPTMEGRQNIVTIVPLSSTKPEKIMPFHCQLPKSSLPMINIFQEQDTWVKGDMIYSVGFSRLEPIRLGRRQSDGKREYFTNKLGRERMREIYACVLHGLNLGILAQYLPE